MAAYEYARPAEALAPLPDRGMERDDDDELSVPAFIFGRTPSLRLEITSAANPSIPFPSSRPVLERQVSNLSSTSSSSAAPPPARPYGLPPGLADSPLPSQVDIKEALQIRHARSAKISTEPPIPLEIQQLLLTTPPPPRRRHVSSPLVPNVEYPPSRPAGSRAFEQQEKPTLIRRIRALTLRNTAPKEEPHVEQLPRMPVPKPEVLDLKRSRRRRVESSDDLLSFHVPQTWNDFERAYASGRMDVESPPSPPRNNTSLSQSLPSRSRTPLPFDFMTPFDLSLFSAPLHLSRLSPIRERLVSSLDLLGTFLPSESALVSPHFSPQFQSPSWTAASPSFSAASSPNSRQDPLFQSMQGAGFRSRGWSSASTAPSTILSTSKSSHFGTSPSYPYLRSIQSHPALESILDRLETATNDGFVNGATITLFPTSPATAYLTVLASSGIASTWREIGIDVALDAHTILNGSRGLVIDDVEKDWRWRGNRDLEERGIRFYAGMPIFAPSSLSLRTLDVSFSVAQFEEEAGGARIAIGVVAVIDDRPKEAGSFGTDERAKLRSIASEITSEIERFVLQRAAAIDALSSRRTSATSAATFQSGSIPAPALRSARIDSSSRSPPSPQRSRNGKGHVKKVSFDANAGPLSSLPLPSPPPPPVAAIPVPPQFSPRVASPSFAEPESIPALFQSHSPQKLLDLACASLARSLDLKLVYLVQLEHLAPRHSSYFGSTSLPSLSLIASHGLPPSSGRDSDDASANFDPALHLQALRAPEGGLLYRAASPSEPFDSGMLLPVVELDETRKGWVIAGYAEQRARRWGAEEMSIFEKVTLGVEKILLWREEWR
ncbi:hypothetical protein JCM11491_007216 [Sporobolomyces phaffii]